MTADIIDRRLCLGVDPGATGAIAVIDEDTGALVKVFDMPTDLIVSRTGGAAKKRVSALGLAVILAPYAGCKAYIEEVASMPGQGVVSVFAFGMATGLLHGALAANRCPIRVVRPRAWTADYGVGSDKALHRAAAKKRWPDRCELFKRAKDDGRADAALIGDHGRRQDRALPAIESVPLNAVDGITG